MCASVAFFVRLRLPLSMGKALSFKKKKRGTNGESADALTEADRDQRNSSTYLGLLLYIRGKLTMGKEWSSTHGGANSLLCLPPDQKSPALKT